MAKAKTKIDMKEIMINAQNKLGRHIDEVKTGCGVTPSKKKYNRKKKHKNTDG
jgi:hypothetical protein